MTTEVGQHRPRRLRLVHVTTVPSTLRAFFGGQLRFFADRGFEVSVIASPGTDLVVFSEGERVPADPVPMVRGLSPARDVVALARLAGRLRRIRPHLVHAHTPKAGLLSMIAATLVGVPIRIYHLHGLRFATASGPARTLLTTTERVACGLSDAVFCVSESLREEARRLRLAAEDKLYLPAAGSINGVDADAFRPRSAGSPPSAVRSRFGIPPDACVVGFVGRIARDKGIGELAEAWSLVRHDRPEAHLLVVGPVDESDPPPGEAWHRLVADASVHVAGQQWDIAEYYDAMDLLVLPSYREGFPVAPLQAAATELPVVATRVTGCVDSVVDGETGTLVPPRDAEALARAIESYVADGSRRRRHGRAGRERVMRLFDPRRVWESTIREYRRLARHEGLLPAERVDGRGRGEDE